MNVLTLKEFAPELSRAKISYADVRCIGGVVSQSTFDTPVLESARVLVSELVVIVAQNLFYRNLVAP